MSETKVDTPESEMEVKEPIKENESSKSAEKDPENDPEKSKVKVKFEDKNSPVKPDPAIKEPSPAFSDEVYACDRNYAIALAQLMAYKDRLKVYKWIERLDTMKGSDELREERDMYLKYLTLSLNHGKLVPPFAKDPPPGLRPLSSVIPRSVHDHIFKGKYDAGDGCLLKSKAATKTIWSLPENIEPKLYFSRQPIPRNGGIVYAAAFSSK